MFMLQRLGLILNVVTALTDICLTVGMVYHLLKERISSQNLNRMVVWLIVFTVNSGFWTTCAAIIILITITVLPPNNLVFAAVYLLSCPLYCNACLGNLIARDFLRERGRPKIELSSVPLEVISEDIPGPQHSAGINGPTFRIHATSFHTRDEPSNDSESAVDRKESSLPQVV